MLLAAFILGLTGSLHCVGMCGVLALQAGRTGLWSVLYHAGRLTTYVVLGLLAGWISRFMAFAGLLGWFSLILGVAVVLFLVFQKTGRWLTLKFSGNLYNLQKQLVSLLRKRSAWAALGIGVLNGWLPCGLVYSAVVVALVQPNVLHGIEVMLLFGLGTVPALVVAKWFATRVLSVLPVSFQKIQTAVLSLTGFLLIWRGASMVDLFSITNTALCYPLP